MRMVGCIGNVTLQDFDFWDVAYGTRKTDPWGDKVHNFVWFRKYVFVQRTANMIINNLNEYGGRRWIKAHIKLWNQLQIEHIMKINVV